MANTLTALIPDVYAALDVVSRELVGFVPSVTLDPSVARAAVGQNVRVLQTGAGNVSDTTPAMIPPNPVDQTINNQVIQITKSRTADFGWTGEEQRGLNTGAGYLNARQQQIAQAIRALCNEVENDIAATYVSASRAFGTAGTTPFADLSSPAQIRKILDDNGAPSSDRSLIINTTAGAAMRTLTNLTKANEAGTPSLLTQGVLLDLHGFKIRESAKVRSVTKGTGAGYVVNNAPGYAVGATSIAVATGTGTILAGDVITFAGDTNKYVVATALAGGLLTLAAPGLQMPLANGAAITVGGNYSANMAFSRNAIVLASRMPALPQEGDLAIDRMEVCDPLSGLCFELAMYPGYRKIRYEISIAWGVKLIKPEHCAILLG